MKETDDIVMIGGILIGGYFLLKYILPAVKGVATVAGAASNAINTLTTPIIPEQITKQAGFPTALTPLELAFPPLGIPKAIEAAQLPIGGPGTPTPSTAALLFPPLGIIEAITKIPQLIGATQNAMVPTAPAKKANPIILQTLPTTGAISKLPQTTKNILIKRNTILASVLKK